jgi:nitric oxide reductase large subunit
MKVDILTAIKRELILQIPQCNEGNTFVSVDDGPSVAVIEEQYRVVFDNEVAFGGHKPVGYGFNFHVTIANKVLTDTDDQEQVTDDTHGLSLIALADTVVSTLNNFTFGYTTNYKALDHVGTSTIQKKIYDGDEYTAFIKVSFYGEYYEDTNA